MSSAIRCIADELGCKVILFVKQNDEIFFHNPAVAKLYCYARMNRYTRSFVKSLLQAALYRPYGATRFVFSVRGGMIWNRQECPPELREKGTCSPNLIVPVPERLFAGGSSTHRAFPRDNLGIPDETLKDGVGVGGTVELIANAEWRIPVASGFEAALFFDVGQVWSDPNNVNLGQLRSGAGFGLHYQTPVGPIRLEYGLKLDRKPGEDAGAFAFSVGYPF